MTYENLVFAAPVTGCVGAFCLSGNLRVHLLLSVAVCVLFAFLIRQIIKQKIGENKLK